VLAAIERARVLADALGEPAVVRVHVRLPQVDPWRLLGHPALDGHDVVAWYDDAEDRCFLAVHVLERLNVQGEARFAQVSAHAAALQARTVDVAWQDAADLDPAVPLAINAFAFATAAAPRQGEWASWPDASLWVPHAVVHRRHARATLVVSEHVAADAVPERIIAELERNLLRVSAAVREPHPARPDCAPLTGPTAGREPVDHDRWQTRVLAARERMRDGAMDKVVLARAESWRAPEGQVFAPFDTAEALRKRQARCTTFAWCRPDGQAFVGATPELLVRVSGDHVSTVAFAGTARRDPNVDDQLLAARLMDSAKDRHEQQLVTDTIASALAPMTRSLQVPSAPHIVALADVLHLETSITGQRLPEHSLIDLVGRLHPTPAVGGLPTGAALRWMAEHEGLDRGWYAGPIGWFDVAGDGAFVVAIRSVLLDRERASAFAGCGLVPDSDPESEWTETLSKLRAVSLALAVHPA